MSYEYDVVDPLPRYRPRSSSSSIQDNPDVLGIDTDLAPQAKASRFSKLSFTRRKSTSKHLSPTSRSPSPLSVSHLGHAQLSSSPQRLVFTTTSLSNTVLATASDSIYYSITTPSWTPHLTTVTRVYMHEQIYQTVAEIEHQPRHPVRVRMYEEKGWWPADAVVRMASGAGPVKGEFTGSDGTRYVWTSAGSSGDLCLFRAADLARHGAAPLATFYPHKRHCLVMRMSQHPTIEISPELERSGILDSMILAFLLVETNRRDRH